MHLTRRSSSRGLFRAACLTGVLVVCLGTHAQAATLVTSDTPTGWNGSASRIAFYNGTNYFLIYAKDFGTLHYKASSDNVTWSEEQVLLSDYYSATVGFNAYLIDDDTFDLVYVRNSDVRVVVRTCTISGQIITAGSAQRRRGRGALFRSQRGPRAGKRPHLRLRPGGRARN